MLGIVPREERRAAFQRMRMEQVAREAEAARAADTNRLRTGAYDAMRAPLGPVTAGTLSSALDLVPVLGDLSGAEDTYQAARGGDYGTAAVLGGATLLGIVPGVGDAASAGMRKGIRAFHGSPHDFDRFDLSKIGTGEGAQAYGHGLYFAEREGVAKSYRDTLSPANMPLNDQIDQALSEFKDIPGEHRSQMRAQIWEILQDEGPEALKEYDAPLPQYRPAWDAATRVAEGKSAHQGRMYEVNINASPDEFLDWDRPLSEQPKAAQDAMRRTLAQTYGEDFFDEYAAQGTGMKDALDNFDDIPAERWASELGKQGIPGIRYLDAGSRTAGDGSRNYVVFDDSLVEIIRKYGLAGLMAMGGMGAAMAPQEAHAAP